MRSPADLAGVPISVGFQSGSHYATVQALEQYLPADQIKLSYAEGMLFGRMEAFLDGKVPACTLFSGPYYFAEQLGFRKVIDNTFMIATMLNGSPEPEDIRRFFLALRRAQRDNRFATGTIPHYYNVEFPNRFMLAWTPAVGGRVSASSSRPTRRKSTSNRLLGLPSMGCSEAARWAQADTRTPSSTRLADIWMGGCARATFDPDGAGLNWCCRTGLNCRPLLTKGGVAVCQLIDIRQLSIRPPAPRVKGVSLSGVLSSSFTKRRRCSVTS